MHMHVPSLQAAACFKLVWSIRDWEKSFAQESFSTFRKKKSFPFWKGVSFRVNGCLVFKYLNFCYLELTLNLWSSPIVEKSVLIMFVEFYVNLFRVSAILN